MYWRAFLLLPYQGYTVVTVFIIASHLMFSRGLESILRQESNLKIVGQEKDSAKALKQIKVMQPNVVIIYGDDESHNFKAAVVDVLNLSPRSKVIGLNLQNNISFVYQAARWVIEDVNELVKIISNPSSGPNLSEGKASLKF